MVDVQAPQSGQKMHKPALNGAIITSLFTMKNSPRSKEMMAQGTCHQIITSLHPHPSHSRRMRR